MSDSDDTDVLLLIPPDFFFVAPSPSPASSPLTVSPPSPSDHSFFKNNKLSLTERQAIESLKELTSQLRLIDRRLSAVESQRSGSMDGENSSIWYDLESYEKANSLYQPQMPANRGTQRQSINVQELLQATAKDSRSINQQQERSMTHSWGPSSREYPMTLNWHFKGLDQRRESGLKAKVVLQERNDSSDDDQVVRERRASSLPPTPSSHHLYQTPPTKQTSCCPPSGYQKGGNSSLWGEGTSSERRPNTGGNVGRAGREALLDRNKAVGSVIDSESQTAEHTAKGNEHSARTVKGPENKSEWVEQKGRGGELMRADDQKDFPGAEDGQSFNMNLSSLDDTLGVSALLPSLSTLGLNASFAHPASIDLTKEASGSAEGGACEGFTLAQVEKLLYDMRKTQAEMEKSIRKGVEHLGKEERVAMRSQNVEIQSDLKGTDDLHRSVQRESNILQVSGMERKNLEMEESGISSIKEPKQWTMGGEVQGPLIGPSVAPADVAVGGKRVMSESQSTEDGGNAYQEVKDKPFSERGCMEEQSDHERFSIYRSKSDESISGKYGRCAGDNNDSFVSSGLITASRVTRLGDTLGSVPDLGLGVREMFAKPEKPRDGVKEPPFVKKKISLLGSINPDAVVRVTEDDSVAESGPASGKIIIEKTKFNGPKSSSQKEEVNPRLLNREYRDENLLYADLSRSTKNPKASHFHSLVVANQVNNYLPQKESQSPPSSANERNDSSSDARRQLNCDEEYTNQHLAKAAETTCDAPLSYTAPRPSMEESSRNQSQGVRERNSREGTEVEYRSQRSEKPSRQMMGQVMVVGGDGSRKGWRGEREKLRRQDEYARFHGQPNNVCRRDVQVDLDKGGQGIMSEVVGAAQRRARKGGREGGETSVERASEQRSSDRDFGKEKHTRFVDSGYGGSVRSLFRGPPPTDAHRLFPSSEAWPPLCADTAESAAASEGALMLRRKLEEERFRREHCERVIEEVGRRALEAQERLAVSEGMSKAKDVALGKFHNAWEEAVTGWKRESEARKALEEEAERYKERAKAEMAFQDRHLKQLEGEVVHLGDESCSLREELRKGQRETAEITARLSAMLEVATKEVATYRKESENATMKEARAKDDASKARETSKEAKEKLVEAIKRAELLESEKVMMKQELETLQGKLRDFTNRISTLESHLADAEVAIDKARQSEKSSCDNLVLARQEWEKERIKLKDFYQSQVEELVRAKVNEFQGQLDAVEHSLRKEAELKEEEAKKLGEERLRMLNEKNSQEVNLLEQKHEEELALWSLRLKRAVAEVDNLKDQVSKHNAQKSQLAKGLHALMQAQLKQGLRLIASGGDVDHEAVQSPPKRIEKPSLETSWREVMASLNIPDNTEVLPEKEYHPKKDVDYLKEKHFQSRGRMDKDLIQSSSNKTSLVPNNDLKKYIHMLLGQEPGKPIGGMADLSSESEEDGKPQILESKQKQFFTKQMTRPLIVSDDHKMVVRERKRSRKPKTKIAEREDPCKLSRDVPVALWEPMVFKSSQPASVDVFEGDPNEQENRRSRKPPWK